MNNVYRKFNLITLISLNYGRLFYIALGEAGSLGPDWKYYDRDSIFEYGRHR